MPRSLTRRRRDHPLLHVQAVELAQALGVAPEVVVELAPGPVEV